MADDRATVAIAAQNGDIFCSGVVVSIGQRTVVASAAHCVDLADSILGGVDALAPEFTAQVTTRAKHERYPEDAQYDVGLLEASGIPSVWPRKSLDGGPAAVVGTTVRISGYGLTALTGDPRRLRESVSVTVEKENESTFQYQQSAGGPCAGDSGGPAVDQQSGRLLGLTSAGDVFCDGYGISARATLLWDMIAPVTARASCLD